MKHALQWVVCNCYTHTHVLHFHPVSFPGSLFAPDVSPVSCSGLLGKLLCLHSDRHFTVDIREQGGGRSDLDYLSGVAEGRTLSSGCPQTASSALFVKDKHNTRHFLHSLKVIGRIQNAELFKYN